MLLTHILLYIMSYTGDAVVVVVVVVVVVATITLNDISN